MAAPNGVRAFYRMTSARPSTVILAGTGRGEEIPVMRRFWRRARIIGIDPLVEHWRFMERSGNQPDVMIRSALYHSEGRTLTFHLNYEPDQRATIYDLPVPIENELTREIPTVSLDGVIERHGPVANCLLWIDIEGGEFEALRASHNLIHNQEIKWLNVELNFCPPRQMPPWGDVHRVIEGYGFRMLGVHSVSRSGRQADAVYIREEAWDSLRVDAAKKGKQRKLERLINGRGRVAGKYREPTEEGPSEQPLGNGRDSRKARRAAAPGQGPA